MTQTKETPRIQFDKLPIRGTYIDFIDKIGGVGCLLAAVVDTESRIPLLTRDSVSQEVREEELAQVAVGIPPELLHEYASPTDERTAARAVIKRTRNIVLTESEESYKRSMKNLIKSIRGLGVLAHTHTFSATTFPEASVEVTPTQVTVPALQVYIPSYRTIYNLYRGLLAEDIGGSYNLPGDSQNQPDIPENLFASMMADRTEYAPVFSLQPTTCFTEPIYE